MSVVLSVKNLQKEYPKFKLENVSFEIESGTIMGLIGRNGAGKTTTIKSILNLIHISGGSIEYFGKDLKTHETKIKKQIGYAGGAVDYYKKKKIKNIAAITKTFYESWDDKAYEKYMKLFEIDEDKTPSELSEGMKVKLNIVIALSHGAKLLILDEPTSGLDPVSRDELLEVFKYIAKNGAAILFSTHITSDLEKCADGITYIKRGKIEFTGSMNSYIENCKNKGIGSNLEEIMIHFEKENLNEKLAQ
ncbi:MAG: ABC transporter ATP-binding protein [Clostridia bacterium]|nr:ABC transporter ATP-binding protein [Clostridia bacterium]